GLIWVAVELATLTTIMLVGLYRTEQALEAAWKYFILGSVGIALALFGTILVYVAAQPTIGEGLDAMAWTVLVARAEAFDPALLNLAFVFLLLGYGTKAGLVPVHGWLPDAHAEGPTPISAVLSGLLLNVALYAVLRFKMLLAANREALAPGPLMIAMGRAGDRGYAWSARQSSGPRLVIARQRRRDRGVAAARLLDERVPDVGSAFARRPWLAVGVVAGLLVALGALFWRLREMSFGESG